MTHHRVRLFARYAELLGADQLEVTLPAGARVADLIAELRRLPGGAALPPEPFVAVNMAQARADTPIRPADELALLPPLAGG